MKKKPLEPGVNRSLSATQQLQRSVPPVAKPLICFDRKTLMLLVMLLSFLSILTVLRVNGSSVACWTRFLQKPSEEGGLFGTPKYIRSDEWAIHTPAILSQVNSREPFSARNYSLGAHKTPLVMNLPVAHFSTLFRPQFWLFFIMNVETAFSFYWNMKLVFVIGGMFFLLMVMLHNNFYQSLFGALWVFFSGFTQWWYSSPQSWPELIGCFALCTAALICMLFSRNKIEITVSSIVFISCSMNFVLFLYPPHQVPLVYLSGALVLGILLRDRKTFLEVCLRDRFRWICMGATACIVVGSLVMFYVDAEETLKALSMTVYPGQRRSLGGQLSVLQIFSGFVGPFMSENHFPRIWGNVCESANFFLFFPIPMAVLGYHLWKKEKAPPLEILMGAFVLVILIWDLTGFPQPLAKITLFDRVTEERTFLPLGIASIVWTCMLVDRLRRNGFRIGRKFRVILSAAALLGICVYVLYFNKASDHFLRAYQAMLLCAFVTACVYFLLGTRPLVFAVFVLVPNIVFHSLVNPVAVGLGPVLENPIYKTTRSIVEKDREGKWIVYGPIPWPNLVFAAGAKVFNGIKWVPDIDELTALSRDPKDAAIYNRYGYISLYPWNGPGIRFTEGQSRDSYIILAHPLDEHWRRLNIMYCMSPLPFRPELVGTAFQQRWVAGPFYVYKYKSAVQ